MRPRKHEQGPSAKPTTTTTTHAARDFLCRDEPEAYVAGGTVAPLHVAFSRDPDSPAKYVQEKVNAAGEEVIKLVQDGGGVIYICGNGNGVVDAVGNTVTTLLQKTCSMSREQARTAGSCALNTLPDKFVALTLS